jgi:hypothetical protein
MPDDKIEGRDKVQEPRPRQQGDFLKRLGERREEIRELLAWVGSVGALLTGLAALLGSCIFGCIGLVRIERSSLTIGAGLSLLAAALAFSILFIATRPK